MKKERGWRYTYSSSDGSNVDMCFNNKYWRAVVCTQSNADAYSELIYYQQPIERLSFMYTDDFDFITGFLKYRNKSLFNLVIGGKYVVSPL
jgi:hypothetical protein